MFVLDFRLEDVGKGQVLYGLRSSPSTTSDPCIGKSCTVTGIFSNIHTCFPLFYTKNLILLLSFFDKATEELQLRSHETAAGPVYKAK